MIRALRARSRRAVAPVAVLAAMLLPASAFAARTDAVIGLVLEPPNLDPTAGAAAAIDEVVYANVFEGLTRFAEDGSIEPLLATGWSVDEAGTSWTFELVEGATFHDGAAFTAEDVKFSLDRARADDSVNAQKALFGNIAAVDVVDDATVAITLAEPSGDLPFVLAWGDAVMLDEASAAGAATKPVGTGPFRFSRWVQGDRVELVRFDGYRGKAPALEKVVFRFIAEPTAAFSALMAGDVDAFPNYPAPENLAQFEADPRFEVVVGSTEGETILAMNERRPPLDDVRVRRAIAKAIDRQEIIDGAMFGYGTPIGSHFAPHHPAYVDLTERSAHDVEGAKALLKEAGVTDLTLSLKLPPPSYARRGGELVAARLREVGIGTRIENVEWAQWLEQVFEGHDYDLTIVSHTEPLDIGIYARSDYYFGYDSPEFQALMGDYAKETDQEKRDALLGDAQRLLADDQPAAFLFELAKTGVAAAGLQGLWANAPTQATDMTKVRWAE